MRITVIGATGGTGKHIVSQALGHGHDVVALVRDPDRLPMRNDRLDVVVGDVLVPETLDDAIRGSRAVLSAIGTGRGLDPRNVYSDGMHNVLQVMDRYVVEKLVAVTAAGVGTENDPNLNKLYNFMIKNVVLRKVLEDMERMENEIMLSDIDWTIVRPAGLSDGPLTGDYRAAEGRSLKGGKQISRADVAAFMLKCMSTDAWDNKGVAIAN